MTATQGPMPPALASAGSLCQAAACRSRRSSAGPVSASGPPGWAEARVRQPEAPHVPPEGTALAPAGLGASSGVGWFLFPFSVSVVQSGPSSQAPDKP